MSSKEVDEGLAKDESNEAPRQMASESCDHEGKTGLLSNEEISRLKKSVAGHKGNVNKLYRDLEKLMTVYENADAVTAAAETLSKAYDNYLTTSSQYLEHLKAIDENVKWQAASESVEEMKRGWSDHQQHLNEWLGKSKTKAQSVVSSRSNRSSGRSSRSSGRSSSSSVKLKEAKVKAAVAKLKLKQLDELHQLKKQQQELKMSEEKIKMVNELEIAEMETKVWEEQDSNSQIKQSEPQKYVTEPIVDKNKESSHHDPKPKVNPAAPEETNSKHITESQPVAVGKATFQLNPNASVWQGIPHLPVVQQNVVCESNDNLEKLLKQQQTVSIEQQNLFHTVAASLGQSIHMPMPELIKFTGNATEYWKFINNFKCNVASKIDDDRLKLSYLIQHCVGEPKEAIENCVILDAEEGYDKALNILLKNYGRPHIVARAYIKDLTEGPQLKGSDTAGLMKMSTKMEKCLMTLTQMGYASDLNNSENLLRIVRRLPMHLRTKWVDRADQIIEAGTESLFSDLVRFMEKRARMVNIFTSLRGVWIDPLVQPVTKDITHYYI